MSGPKSSNVQKGKAMSMPTDEELLRETRLIESYKEQTASWRHIDRGLWGLTAIIIPVAFAALGAPYVYKKMPYGMPIVGGLFLMLFWWFSCEIYHNKNKIRFNIIHNMEEYMKVKGHKTWADNREKCNTGWRRLLKSRYLRRGMFWIYFFVAVFLLLYKYL